jgi:hypothetical protein
MPRGISNYFIYFDQPIRLGYDYISIWTLVGCVSDSSLVTRQHHMHIATISDRKSFKIAEKTWLKSEAQGWDSNPGHWVSQYSKQPLHLLCQYMVSVISILI